MNKEIIDIKEIKNMGFTKIEKVINTSLQLSDKDLDKIIEFNKQNDYEYTIRYNDHNLVDSKNIIKLIRRGYVMQVDSSFGGNDIISFKHEDLVKRERQEWEERYKK